MITRELENRFSHYRRELGMKAWRAYAVAKAELHSEAVDRIWVWNLPDSERGRAQLWAMREAAYESWKAAIVGYRND